MHQTDALVAKLLECGALTNMPHFSCSHYPQVSDDRHGQMNFEFADFGAQNAQVRFIFRGTGEILFSGLPNRWSTCQYSDIFRGQSQAATADLLAFSLESIPLIKNTIDLYAQSIPHEDYSALLQLWAHISPELFEKPTEAHFTSSWRKIW